ncbi:MAG: OmpA family protein [Deltaproteobacteria bacterium]|nr:OmpA family protein [Deltaproteobacteria bacterium]
MARGRHGGRRGADAAAAGIGLAILALGCVSRPDASAPQGASAETAAPTVIDTCTPGETGELRVVLRNDLSESVRVAGLSVSLDGSLVLDSPALGPDETLPAWEGVLPCGEHEIAVQFEFRGEGHMIFSYLEGYRFRVSGAHRFFLPDNTLLEIRATARENGCADPPVVHFEERPQPAYSATQTDADGDGVPDRDDLCPGEAEDPDGFEDENGCPDPDNDNDRIPDDVDECPDEPERYNGTDDEDGCPDCGALLLSAEMSIAPVVWFAVGTADIAQEAPSRTLDLVAYEMIRVPSIESVAVVGRAAPDESDPSDLAVRRANAIVDALAERGVERTRLLAVGGVAERLQREGGEALGGPVTFSLLRANGIEIVRWVGDTAESGQRREPCEWFEFVELPPTRADGYPSCRPRSWTGPLGCQGFGRAIPPPAEANEVHCCSVEECQPRCESGEGAGCRAFAYFLQREGDDGAVETTLRRACDLGYARACTDLPLECSWELPAREVHFADRSAEIAEESSAVLHRVALELRVMPDRPVRVQVSGYAATDEGTPEERSALSEARARAAADVLIGNGVDACVLEVVGYGDACASGGAEGPTAFGDRRARLTVLETESDGCTQEAWCLPPWCPAAVDRGLVPEEDRKYLHDSAYCEESKQWWSHALRP